MMWKKGNGSLYPLLARVRVKILPLYVKSRCYWFTAGGELDKSNKTKVEIKTKKVKVILG